MEAWPVLRSSLLSAALPGLQLPEQHLKPALVRILNKDLETGSQVSVKGLDGLTQLTCGSLSLPNTAKIKRG